MGDGVRAATGRGGPPVGRERNASRAFVLSFVNTVISKFGTVAIGIVLARLLGPSQFGTYAIAMVALLAILSFNELGVSLAIVRWPTDPREIAPTVTTISVVTSALIFVGAWAGAPVFATAMGDPAATDVVRLMAVCVIIDGAVAAPAALLQREFRQGTRLAIDQVNVWMGALISVVLVASGVGAMSLAAGRLAGSLAAAVLFAAFSPMPIRFGWRRDRVRPLLAFGAPLAGASIIAFAAVYADQLVAGALLGTAGLGLYVLASNIATWPTNIFSQPLRGVAPALFSKLQSDHDAMREAFLTIFELAASAVIPLVVVMSTAALPLISVVYGPAWGEASTALVWLSACAGLRIFFELIYDYLVVLGESRPVLWVQTLWAAGLVPALLIGGSAAGLAGLAAAVFAVGALIVLPVYLVLLRRRGFALTSLVRRTLPPVGASVPLAVAVILINATVGDHFLALAASAACGAAVAGTLLMARRRKLALLRGWDRKERVAA